MDEEQRNKIDRLKEALRDKKQDEIINKLSAICEELKILGIRVDDNIAEKLRNIVIDHIELPEIKLEPSIEVKLPGKVNVDWENFPRQKETTVEKTDLKPVISAIGSIKFILDSVNNFIRTAYQSVINAINRIIFLLSDPDELIIESNKITEIYGKKRVIYDLKFSNNKLSKVTRNES